LAQREYAADQRLEVDPPGTEVLVKIQVHGASQNSRAGVSAARFADLPGLDLRARDGPADRLHQLVMPQAHRGHPREKQNRPNGLIMKSSLHRTAKPYHSPAVSMNYQFARQMSLFAIAAADHLVRLPPP
jgi:hypothetical protein